MKDLIEEMRDELCQFLPKVLALQDCWLWQGKVDDNGYGIFHCQGQTFQAHRSAAILFGKRAVLPKMVVYHTCYNKLCCNPQHLRIRDKFFNHTYDCMGIEPLVAD